MAGTITGTGSGSQYDCPAGTEGTKDCYGILVLEPPGTVSSDVFGSSLVGATILLELELSTSRNSGGGTFNPSKTNLSQAQFVGANDGADLFIVNGGQTLLAFDVGYVDVSGYAEGPNASLTLGAAELNTLDQRFGSLLTLVGGTLNTALARDGIGSLAVLRLEMSGLSPDMPNQRGFLSQSFTASNNTIEVTFVHNPEPATVGLIGMGLLGLVAAARRRARAE